jgi:hypothetical protein
MGETGEPEVALVTGGSRGIGKQIAATLAESGLRVVVTSRTREAAEAAAAEIGGAEGRVTGIALDVSDDDSVSRGVAGRGKGDLRGCRGMPAPSRPSSPGFPRKRSGHKSKNPHSPSIAEDPVL